MGISPIILDNSILQENVASFPAFPTANKQIFNVPTEGTNFIVPAGVNWIGAKIWGAGGGGGHWHQEFNVFSGGGAGQNGSYAEVIISVTPGEVLQIRVGGFGSSGQRGNLSNFGLGGLGGINGGGTGGVITPQSVTGSNSSSGGGGGGGYSGVFNSILSPSRAIAVIGGGGGGGGGSISSSDFSSTPGTPGGAGDYGTIQNSASFNGGNGNSGTGAGGGGGGAGGGAGGVTFSRGASGGNPLAVFDDSSLGNFFSTLSNPVLNYRKISTVRRFNNGMNAANDPDFIAAGNNFCAGGAQATNGKNGLVVISWN